jgi:hemerythrin-like domain-containing protein
MKPITQPLRYEHKELLPHVDRILKVADMIGEAPVEEACRGIDEVYDFLVHYLKPHAEAEDEALYPVVGQVLGSPEATMTMSRDHLEVRQYIDELLMLKCTVSHKQLTHAQIKDLRRVLYGVYALIKVHFAKEEEVYLPILDQRLTLEAAQEMFERMDAAASRSKHKHP